MRPTATGPTLPYPAVRFGTGTGGYVPLAETVVPEELYKTMQYDEMIDALTHRAPLGAVQARTALAAVVQALGETAKKDEMRDLRSQLPAELKTIEPDSSAPDRSIDDFCVRVGELTEIDDSDQAGLSAGAALSVLAEAVTPGQLSQLLASLPHGYAQLLHTSNGRAGG